MNILITGAAGFIGSHLTDRFLASGHRVIGVDNFVTGRMNNLEHISSDNFRFIKADITKDDFDPGEPLDGVLNFASPASPIDFKSLALEIMEVNSTGTKNCLELAKKKGARFMMASTSEVYGDPLVHPQKEDYFGNVNPRGIRSVYDEGKRFSEALIYAYRRLFNLEVRVARIFNTYGPRMRPDDGRVIPNFMMQALNDEPLTIFGDGSQTRSFCFVGDEVEGLYRLFNSDYSDPVNMGNPSEKTIMELVQALEKVMDKKLKVTTKPLPGDDPKKRRPDISLAKKVLEWEPKIELVAGLKQTLDWFQKLK